MKKFFLRILFSSFLLSSLNATEFILGGDTTEGALQITYKDKGYVFVEKYVSGAWAKQFYKANKDESGMVLVVDGTFYKLGKYGSTMGTMISDGDITNGKFKSWTKDNITLRYEITYKSPKQYFKHKWIITNNSGASKAKIVFIRAIDTYLSGGDSGAGTWDADSNTVGVKKIVSAKEQTLTFQGITTPSGYSSKRYSAVNTDALAGKLNNDLNEVTTTDNGYGLEWTTTNLANDTSWSITAYESFTLSSLEVKAPPLTKCAIGTTCTLEFDVKNIHATDADTIALSSTNSETWVANLDKTSLVNLAATGSEKVNISVTVPDDANVGDKSEVILTAKGLTSEKIGIAIIEAIAAPVKVCNTSISDIADTFTFDLMKKENLESTFVTSDLNLSKVYEINDCEVKIEWSSSFANVANADSGKIILDNDDTHTLVLTAKFILNSTSSKKTFIITTPKKSSNLDDEAVNLAHSDLTFETIRKANFKRSEITSDLNLTTTGKASTTIVWSSDKDSVISSGGVVKRSSTLQNVVLSAKISKGSDEKDKTFSLVVPSNADSNATQTDVTWLSLASILGKNSDAMNITQNLVTPLPTTAPNGSSISYESSLPSVLSNIGIVNRSIGDKFIKLSVTVGTEMKKFLFKVLGTSNKSSSSDKVIFKKIDESKDIPGAAKVVKMLFDDKTSGTSVDGETSMTFDSSISSNVDVNIEGTELDVTVEFSKSVLKLIAHQNGTSQACSTSQNGITTCVKTSVKSAKITVAKDGTTQIANGNLKAKVDSNGKSSFDINATKVSSNIEGSTVEITDGEIKISNLEIVNGDMKDAIAQSSLLGKSLTKFVVVDIASGTETSIALTLKKGSEFDQNSTIEILKDNYDGSGVKRYFKIKSPLNGKLTYE
ncbi:MAG: hypothetical protein GQ570_09440 [Helicobacteraceae bacterium]|nr:hypothetical protein [Helicobacteraceae bacterium]